MPVNRKAVKNKVDATPRENLSMLSEEIIAKAGVGIYIVQKGNFVYVSNLFQKITGFTVKNSSANILLEIFILMTRKKSENRPLNF